METEAEKTARLKALRLARDAGKPKPVAKDAHYTLHGMKTEFRFGQFKGQIVEDVLDSDRGLQWVKWAIDNIDLQVDDEVSSYLESVSLGPKRLSRDF